MVVSIVVTFLAFKYNINFNIDLTLISIAMIFPLVFTIRGSFRRREKALEHLSKFRSALKTVHYFVMSDNELSEENKNEISNVLVEISETTIAHLRLTDNGTKEFDEIVNKVYKFVIEKEEFISRRLRDRVFRFMKDLHESIENLRAIHIHRTPIGLKAYCLLFIYIFPFIYAPIIINNIGLDTSQITTYIIVATTNFILISLYNIQDQLEYPFDDQGLDDIKLDNFKFDR